jgi:hypothetical protein
MGDAFATNGADPTSFVPVGLFMDGELVGTPIWLPLAFGCGFLNFDGGIQKSGSVSCMFLVPIAFTG